MCVGAKARGELATVCVPGVVGGAAPEHDKWAKDLFAVIGAFSVVLVMLCVAVVGFIRLCSLSGFVLVGPSGVAAPAEPVAVERRDKRVQAQCTYTAVRGVAVPRFEPLRDYETDVMDY